MAWTALKEATELFAAESSMGKISRLAIEIVDATQSRLLRAFKPNNRASNELAYDVCLLASSLADLRPTSKDSDLNPENNLAKLSPIQLKALQITLQEIKVFAQRRADEAIWKLYLSAKSDSGKIKGFSGRLREALDVLMKVQSNIATLEAIKQKDPQAKIQDGSRTNLAAVPLLTRSSGLPSPTSTSCDGSVGQPASIADASNKNVSLKVETLDDLRLVLSTTRGVNALLELEEGPVVAQAVDLLQLEIRSARLDMNLSGYPKKCATCLEALVNKHRTLPTSLFVNDVTKEGTRPCNWGGYSVCAHLGLLKVPSEDRTKDIWKGTQGTQAVCLKVLRLHIQGRQRKEDKLVKAFHKEALLWTRLSHPNLLPLIGVNTTLFPQGFCLVSPWMTNGDIIGFLESNPDHDRLVAILEISAAMAYLHECEIVHGDIKGANVLVNEAGQCLLADFGLAITVAESTPLVKSSTSEMKGSIRWMAPELFRSSNGVCSATTEGGKERINKFPRDLYAFACTVLEVIIGKPPFAELTDPTVMYEVMVNNVRPPRPPSEIFWCPDNVWALVQRCWAERPQDRPKASEVHEILSKLASLRDSGDRWEDGHL
ncbi:MAP kinase kinase kinase activity protein [Marasmius sp. AFHP31]|nr:MAP kinase kinase kinase activity protein [Marasmius sp. AFHP31]